MYHLTKYEKENILLSNADEDFWSVYINSKPLKRRFAEFDRKNHGVLLVCPDKLVLFQVACLFATTKQNA